MPLVSFDFGFMEINRKVLLKCLFLKRISEVGLEVLWEVFNRNGRNGYAKSAR